MADLPMRLCADVMCMMSFQPTRHNQKYCSKECCRRTTNAKIMKLYYEEKDRKSGKIRICSTCEVAQLSRYNETSTCASCIAKKQSEGRRALLEALGF